MEKDSTAEFVQAAKKVTRRQVSVLAQHRDLVLASLAEGASLNAIRIVLNDEFSISISRQALHQWIKRQLGGETPRSQPASIGVAESTAPVIVDVSKEVSVSSPSSSSDAGEKGDVDLSQQERVNGMVKQIYEFMKIEPLNKE